MAYINFFIKSKMKRDTIRPFSHKVIERSQFFFWFAVEKEREKMKTKQKYITKYEIKAIKIKAKTAHKRK